MNTRPVAWAVCIAGLLIGAHYLPFAPGRSVPGTPLMGQVAQLAGFASLLLVPLGLLLLLWRLFRRPPARGDLDGRPRGWWVVPALLLTLPPMVVAAQLYGSSAAAGFARDRAIASSAELIQEIEGARARTGSYPESLLALNPDVRPDVVGIDRFHYEQLGDSYQLVFECPRFQPFGTRELVVYHPRGQHVAVSHALWRISNPSLRGWYVSGAASADNWRWFWFD